MNAAAILARRRTFDTAAEWGDLLGSFGAKRLAHESSVRPEETVTRFNSPKEAAGTGDRLALAFDGAKAGGYDRGVILTGTTRPTRYDSLALACEGLMADAKALRKKVGRDTPSLDGVPPGVTVVEPTERGVPHVHLLLFGVMADDVPSDHELSRFWNYRGRGYVLHADEIVLIDGPSDPPTVTAADVVRSRKVATDGGRSGRGRWRWETSEDERDHPDTAGTPPRAYLSSGAAALRISAGTDSATLLALADAYREMGDRPVTAETASSVDGAAAAVEGVTRVSAAALRRAAWYWATGLKAVTRPSPSLSAVVKLVD